MKDKAILVIDMPKTCRECELTYYDSNYSDYFCSLTGEFIYYVKDKYSGCPLSSLPSSINLKQYVYNAELNMESMLAYQYAQGWNNCLQEIMAGEE